jgi:hypothetical protein
MSKAQAMEEKVVAEPPTPTTSRAIDLARAAEMLPEMFAGTKLQPAVENPKAWLYRAAKLRFRMGDDDQITEQEFNARIAEIGTVLAR